MRAYSVYPSYPKDAEPEDISKVLIVSYCWTQDAERLGVLMNGDGTAKPELIKIVLRDLAVVHGVSLDWLEELYTPGDYFAWDWNHNPLSMGSRTPFVAATVLLNDNFRCIRAVWTGFVWRHEPLQ